MEVIKPGKLRKDKNPKYKGECSNCHCVVECIESELQLRAGLGYVIKCPTEDCICEIVMHRITLR